MAILEAADAPLGNVNEIGLAIRATEWGQHAGILYQHEGQARLLHLAFHHLLQDEVATPPYRWVQINLDPVNKIVLSALVSRIANKAPLIPYGFNSDGVCFDDQTGDLVACPAGRGLTCATFILAVFSLYAFDLVDMSTWESRAEDEIWKEQIVSLLEQHAPAEHVQAVREDRNAPRFRPDEVVGASTHELWPVEFQTAQALAEQIRRELI